MSVPSRFTKEGIPIYEPPREVQVWDPVEAAKAAVPLLDSQAKMDYLEYRACGFTIREACMLTGIGQKLVSRWRREDPIFASWEGERLFELQHTLGDRLVHAKFLRNMIFKMNIDGQALSEVAMKGLQEASSESIDWAKGVASHYKSQDYALMEKVVQPDMGQNTGGTTVNVHVEGDLVVDEHARRAASKKLLEDFTRNSKIIDASSRVLVDDDSST